MHFLLWLLIVATTYFFLVVKMSWTPILLCPLPPSQWRRSSCSCRGTVWSASSCCHFGRAVRSHSLVFCVTFHSNRCVSSFDGCQHDRAHLSNFLSCVMPNHPPPTPPTAPLHTLKLPLLCVLLFKNRIIQDKPKNSVVDVVYVRIVNVTPEGQLHPPGQQEMLHHNKQNRVSSWPLLAQQRSWSTSFI